MSDLQFVDYQVDHYIASVILKRPPVNALNRALVADLTRAAEIVRADIDARKVRVLVIAAEGKHFCAGADLKERREMSESEVERAVRDLRNMVNTFGRMPVPTIAAVQGSAIGGGCELALAADLRVLADTAQMGLRETALAIIPGAGGTQRLPRLIGYTNALYWIATARVFNADEVSQFGLALRVVPESDLRITVRQIAAHIAANGPIAVQQAKRAMQLGLNTDLETGLEIEWDCYRSTIPTKDRLEGLQAFAEKRSPSFRGE
jgi:enoyl-CoA hydratase/carnithine racemase